MISFGSKTHVINHGGNIEEAIKHYNIPKEQWIDLSTGISPWAYPVKHLPEHVWQELPHSNHELLTVAAKYYDINAENITATPGSQMAIRLIPQLFEPANVAIPSLGYQEHLASWQMANHQITIYHNTTELLDFINNKRVDHAVVVNPNNPSGEKLSLLTVKKIASRINGVCIVDEAFIDFYQDGFSTQEIDSAIKILGDNHHDKLIILRSVGKFFGLAGIRLGFAIGSHPILPMLNNLLEPWAISHASQHIGIQALQDSQWQRQQKANINQQQNAFQTVLKAFLNNNLKEYSLVKTSLFSTVFADREELAKLHHQLATQGIWTRLDSNSNENSDGKSNEPAWLRFGLPKNLTELEKRTLHL